MPSKNQKNKKMINRQLGIYGISKRKLLAGERKGKYKSLITRAKVRQRKIIKLMRERSLFGSKLRKRIYKSLMTLKGPVDIKRVKLQTKKKRRNQLNQKKEEKN